ncbi:MAG: NADH-quinone oxidoreductase subunit NuoK [bacterium]|nr:NADH-quinone oxidoreductase subunit NuoK [bacterium]
MIPLYYYTILSAVLFVIGLIGFLIRRNIILLFMSIEVMLNAVNINLVSFSSYYDSLDGQILSIFVMAIAAAEAAVGFGILIAFYRNKNVIDSDKADLMKW